MSYTNKNFLDLPGLEAYDELIKAIIAAKANASSVGVANGIADLDANAKLPATRLPLITYVNNETLIINTGGTSS